MAGRMDEGKLYKQLKKAYQDLEIDDTADEKTIKKKYRVLAKKYHPDANPGDKEAEEKFKAISVGYALLIDEKNRRVYQKLKEKYENSNKKYNDTYSRSTYSNHSQGGGTYSQNGSSNHSYNSQGTGNSSGSQKNSSSSSKNYYRDEDYEEYTYESSYTKPEEKHNQNIFKRRDGSTVEILPVGRVELEGQTFYEYKIAQYYKDKTIINNLYGRINLQELFVDKEYCDFCTNVFLSEENIKRSIVQYNGFLGYIEVARKPKGNFYRMADRDRMELFDISIDLGSKVPKQNILNIDKPEINVLLEKFGTSVINGKILNQYVYYSDYLNQLDLIYSEDIDFVKYRKDPKYAKAVETLVVEERAAEKIKQGGYVGSIAYNVETDSYDIVMDKEMEKTLNVKQTEGR